MSRVPPINELVNVLEFEDVAKSRLSSAAYSAIAGSDRTAFERMTFRPRMNIPTTDMDLSVELFGDTHFTPILLAPISDQKRFHPDGELATLQGAAAAKTAMIVSSRSSVPLEQIAASAKVALWYSVYAEPPARRQLQQAVAAGFKVACVTRPVTVPRIDWNLIDQIRSGITIPIVLKGVMTPEDARTAIQRGFQGVVVSNHGGAAGKAPIEVLPAIAEVIGGKAPILIDGSFRRGTDILKALILGARGVLIGRPAMWGLASYGPDGVRTVIELLQSDLGRNMGNIGAPTLKDLSPSMIRIHTRAV